MNFDWQARRRAQVARDVGRREVLRWQPLLKSIAVPVVLYRQSRQERPLLPNAARRRSRIRPCLRCRPECFPGTPAWLGSSGHSSRALRLIAETGLEDGGVEKLACRLGVGARHLSAPLMNHLGATPSTARSDSSAPFCEKADCETTLP